MQDLAVECRSEHHLEAGNGNALAAIGNIDENSGNKRTAVIFQTAELVGLAPVSTVVIIVEHTADFFLVVLVRTVLNDLTGQSSVCVVTGSNLCCLDLNGLVLRSSHCGNCSENADKSCQHQQCNQKLGELFHILSSLIISTTSVIEPYSI